MNGKDMDSMKSRSRIILSSSDEDFTGANWEKNYEIDVDMSLVKEDVDQSILQS